MKHSIHYRLGETMQWLGARNILVRCALRWLCRRSRLRFGNDFIDVIRGRNVVRIANRHLAYAPNVANSFEHFFDGVEPVRGGGGDSLIVDFSSPRLHRYRASGLEFEFSSFAEELGALTSYFRWYHPRPGDTVFDIGAYCGGSSYELSQVVGESGKVIAFEPDPLNYDLLLRNMERHKLANVVAVHAAVSDQTGTAEVFCEGALGSTLTQYSTRGSSARKIPVQTWTLADACEKFGLPTFAKVDIEGAEIAMIRAACPFLRDHGISFAIDTGHVVNGRFTSTAVEELFRSIGYRSESSAEYGPLTTFASPGQADAANDISSG